jgi:hypothetical protein
MTTFNLDAVKSGTWFPFQESTVDPLTQDPIFDEAEKGAGEILLRSSTPFIRKQAAGQEIQTKPVMNSLTRRMEFAPVDRRTPEQKQQEQDDMWDYVIVDWKGFKDANGKEIPCTRENKLLLMDVDRFIRFVGHALKIIDQYTEVKKEKLEKN